MKKVLATLLALTLMVTVAAGAALAEESGKTGLVQDLLRAQRKPGLCSSGAEDG